MAKKKVVELPSREELVSLAQEVNAVLNLENPIKFGKKVTDDDLQAAIIKETTGNLYEIDFTEDPADSTIPFYSAEAADLFALLEVEVLPGSPDAPEADEPVEEEKPVEEDKPAKKGKEKPAADKPVASTKSKDKPAKSEPAAKAEKPVKAAKEENKYTRSHAFVDVLKKTVKTPMKQQEIIDAVDALYVKNGGNPGVAIAYNVTKYNVAVMLLLGTLVKVEGGLQYNP